VTSVTERPAIPAARYADRLTRAGEATAAGGLDALLIGVGADLSYLTGYHALPLERLTMLVITPARSPFLVVPRLEASAAAVGTRTPIDTLAWDETDDPYGLIAARLGGALSGRGRQRIGVSDTLAALHLLRLQAALPAGTEFVLASTVLRSLRMIKDPDEIALLTLAAHAADRVVAAIAGGRLVGRTEADVAAEVRDRLVTEGHDQAAFAIVGSGRNSASPHHEASDRVIEAGEPIVLDIGGTVGGYGSDITRMLWTTGGDPANGPDDEFRRLFDVLYRAQAAGTAAALPGVACETVDAAARSIIDDAGYGPAFIHRTGHGIGLETHEDPYLVAGNALPLEPGMAFSIEPGIYLEGRYGARIEDIVVCDAAGPLVLNEAPRQLLVVEG
jgi:Xaa-Pro aminopeptidase